MRIEELGKDWRGNEFRVGATVVYPSRHSSSVWMTEATIEEIHYNAHDRGRITELIVHRTKTTRGGDITKPRVKLTNIGEVLVVGVPLRSHSTADWNAVRGMR